MIGEPVVSNHRFATASCTAMPPPFAAISLEKSSLANSGLFSSALQRVHGRKRIDLETFQLLDRARDIARIRNHDAHAARAQGQETANSQCEYVIKRQRHDCHELIDVRPVLASWIKPDFGLQDVRDQVPMQQHRALRYACRATGVLEKSDVVGTLLDGFERFARTLSKGCVKTHMAG